MTKWLALLIACLGLALVTGCGGDDDEGSGGQVTTEQSARSKPAGETVEAKMKDVKFVPAKLKVKAGGAVRWTNEDSFEHTVTYESGPGEKFDSGEVRSGGRFSSSFESKGTIAYVCRIHPFQKGQVVVE